MWCDQIKAGSAFRRIVIAVAMLALAGDAYAQSVLADKTQSGDRKTALALIDSGADVGIINGAQPDGSTVQLIRILLRAARPRPRRARGAGWRQLRPCAAD